MRPLLRPSPPPPGSAQPLCRSIGAANLGPSLPHTPARSPVMIRSVPTPEVRPAVVSTPAAIPAVIVPRPASAIVQASVSPMGVRGAGQPVAAPCCECSPERSAGQFNSDRYATVPVMSATSRDEGLVRKVGPWGLAASIVSIVVGAGRKSPAWRHCSASACSSTSSRPGVFARSRRVRPREPVA
jgi:hypothetical protein